MLVALAAASLSGCGGGSVSPSSVVRAWSTALNSGDNEAAADLFADGAEVIQGASLERLRTHQQAVAFNASLPCTGRIVALESAGEEVRATFVLGNRRTSRCDGPGEQARAVIRVHAGKIVLWHQLATGPEEPAPIV